MGQAKRKAHLILHRKVHGERKCICGSELKIVGGFFVCKKQYKTKEPNQISVEFSPVLGKDFGEGGDSTCEVRGVWINGVMNIISVEVKKNATKSIRKGLRQII